VHGSGFGQKPGTKHMRIVFLPPEDVLHAAYNKISDFMAERYKT
jgi:alanine-synthesizing transaminase